ncbi:MAG TPA: extracellular solute-binding protein [Candidatus Hydrogenedentes bacterium]|mgnify:FL=1|nr:extracellular solute-binding protein [Candidatus Hydrogenedentota bacterium]HPC17930.1 extracellular solute-binding protein [Candidatus Hydrogenedentota bacterium]HRT19203.1 extracellular solute-binding protein [Candidatus Hydrogenedentota bacterium]HRT66416.1 extracellular solute-binding protein [Candidatus Hydrogenedentota bacterium]
MCRRALWVAILAGFGAAADPLSDAPALEPTQIRGDLQVWAWNIAAGSLDKLAPGFNGIFPNCRVNVHMSGANLQSRFLLSLSAGVGAPDISQLQIREAPRYSITGKLADLTDVAKKYETMFPASFWQDCVYQGRIHAIPWDMGPCAVFYKRPLFDRFGINPETIETWDDYIAAGKELVARSNGKTRMLCLATGSLGDFFELLAQQNNAQIFDAQGRIAIHSPEMLDVFVLLKKMFEAGIGANIAAWGPEFMASLKADSVATYPTAAWFGGTIRDYAPDTSGSWGVFRLPAFRPGGLRTSNLGGSVLVIPDQCTQKFAAWKFIEYALCTPAPQIEQYRNFELFPALTTTHGDPFFDEDVPFFGGQKVRRLFSMDIDKIPPMIRTTDWMEAMRYISQALSKWATGGLGDPAILLEGLEDKLSRRLNRAVAP